MSMPLDGLGSTFMVWAAQNVTDVMERQRWEGESLTRSLEYTANTPRLQAALTFTVTYDVFATVRYEACAGLTVPIAGQKAASHSHNFQLMPV
jgi:hypothetical protein